MARNVKILCRSDNYRKELHNVLYNEIENNSGNSKLNNCENKASESAEDLLDQLNYTGKN